MTTPPAHAAQTVDVSRAAVEELCVHLESVACRPDSNGDPECFDEGQARAADMLRALFDAKEKAEQDAARYQWLRLYADCYYNDIFNDELSFESVDSAAYHLDKKIDVQLARTGNDDTGEMT